MIYFDNSSTSHPKAPGAAEAIKNILDRGCFNINRGGDHAVTTQMEHNSVIRPLAQLQDQGVRVDIARCRSDGKLDLDDIESKITAQTKLVVMTHASEEYGIMTRCGLHCAPGAHKALGTFPRGLLRCSLGHKNTEAEVDMFITALTKIIG